MPRDDSSSWNFVVADAFGHEVDIHVIDFNAHGHGGYGPKERGIYYPAAAIVGKGNSGTSSQLFNAWVSS